MSTCAIAVAWALAAFVLIETVLPRLYGVLRTWRHKVRAAARAKDAARTRDAAPATDAVQTAATTATVAATVKPRVEPAAEPAKGRDIPDAPAKEPTPSPPSPAADTDSPGPVDESRLADSLWSEAREMRHRFIPDAAKDGDYLAKLHEAAKLGHLEAMVKLGQYALRRKAFVEAYYWSALAELKGAKGLEESLRNIRSAWLTAGCPNQHGNVYDGFTAEQGSFARALLRMHCAVDRPIARERMKTLAADGCQEARLFLAGILCRRACDEGHGALDCFEKK